ncbi:MAG: DnaJ C-terminal domain-containing protein [Actinomycetes bacterium]
MSAKDLYEKDYYKILGVPKDADAPAIKKAYRKLAKDLHPDKNAGDKKIEDKFKAVSEAYDVVSDPKRRAEYDEARRYGASGPMGGGRRGSSGGFPGGQNINVDDLFGGGQNMGDLGDIFGGLFGGGRQRGPRKGSDLETSVTISFENSIQGVTLPLRLSTGNISARIPAGVKNDQRIRLKGKGQTGEPGAPAGDLFINVTVSPHPVFGRDGDNLTVVVPVRFDEAVNGADIKVPVLDGPAVTIRIPAGTKTGAKFRARGKGVTRPDKSGDLIVSVDIAVPKDLSKAAQKALDEFTAATSDFDPREELMRKTGNMSDKGVSDA